MGRIVLELSVENNKDNDYSEYYQSVAHKGRNTKAVGIARKKRATCPNCNTVASHSIHTYKSKNSLLECAFCSGTFPALGNC